MFFLFTNRSKSSKIFHYFLINPAPRDLYHSVHSSNKQISLHIRNNDFPSALALFNSMPIKTTITYNSLLSFYARSPGHLRSALHLFAEIPSPDVVSYNTLLSCYLVNSDFSGARGLFESMPVRDSATWNTMVSGLFRRGRGDKARELFGRIPEKNSVSWNVVVSGLVQAGDMALAEEYFRLAPDRDDVVLRTAMISGYMSLGKIKQAQEIFSSMTFRNPVTWNAMLAGFINNGQSEEGLKLFRLMIGSAEVGPNQSTLCSALLACSNLSGLNLGRQIHQWVSKLPWSLNVTVLTSLVSMYCKCGHLDDAWKLFCEMAQRDVVSWNAIMSGYAQHGLGERAIQLFNEMKQGGVEPNEITFVALLSACNHAGLTEFGKNYFESMEKVYGVTPQLDHYSCMVDMPSRLTGKHDGLDPNNAFRVSPVCFWNPFGCLSGSQELRVCRICCSKID